MDGCQLGLLGASRERFGERGKRERKIQSPFLFLQPTDAIYVSFFCFVVEFFYGGAAMRADMSKKS